MIRYVLVLGLISSIASVPLLAAENDGNSETSAIVEIDGAKINLSQLEHEQPSSLFHARNVFYEAEKKAINSYVDKYLLEKQAEKENLTVDQLLEKHVNSTIAKDPSEEALRVYYEGVDTTQPYEQVREQIITHLRQARIEKAKAAYMKSLRDEAKVSLLLAPPRAPLNMQDVFVQGDVDKAPVTIVEYADYECPYCQQEQPTVARVEADFKGKIAFVYKDTPLPMHSHAEKAAEAARCAGVQGHFWEYHDHLFQAKQLELAQLKQAARDMKLDGDAFDKCLDSGKFAQVISKQLDEARSLQIEGTPTFFINGRYYQGGLPYEQFKSIIEDETRAATATASR